MRIIAGEFRGRKLLPPATDATRPITDRVKQSLFDILTPRLEDAIVYDCFCGTGSMGLESLSRGAAHATFFESDRSALDRLEKNIRTLGLERKATIVRGDLFAALRRPPLDGRASLAFLDPPYRFVRERPEDLIRLAANLAEHHLAEGGWVTFRHDADDELQLPPLHRIDRREYGSMTIDFLQKE